MEQSKPKSDQTRLREAFSKPGSFAVIVDENNRKLSDTPIHCVTDELVAATRPKDGILVIDADTKRTYDTAQRAIHLLSIQQFILCTSGSTVPGLRRNQLPYKAKHIVVITPEGLTTFDLAALLNNVGVPRNAIRFGDGGLTRPPLTPHRLGHPVNLISPDAETAIAWLTAAAQPLGNSSDELKGLPYESIRPQRALDLETLDLARYGNRDGRYENRDIASFAFARRLAERGQEFETFWVFLNTSEFAIGERHREQMQFQGVTYVKSKALSQWNKAVLQCGKGLPKAHPDFYQHVEAVCRWKEQALAYVGLNPRTRDSDRQLVLAIANQMIDHHSCVVMPGTLGMSLRMGVAINTVTAALERWSTAGIIAIIKPETSDRLTKADKFAVDLSRFDEKSDLIDLTSGWTSDISHPALFLPIDHACWNGNAMGTSAMRVYSVLTEGQMTNPDLEMKTNLGRKAIANAISMLRYVAVITEANLIDGPFEPEGTYVSLPLIDPESLACQIIDQVHFAGSTTAAKQELRKVAVETKKKGFAGYMDWQASKDAYEAKLTSFTNLNVPR